jgi:hypothetical protein
MSVDALATYTQFVRQWKTELQGQHPDLQQFSKPEAERFKKVGSMWQAVKGVPAKGQAYRNAKGVEDATGDR